MEASPLLDRYKGIVDVSLIEQIYEVAHALADLRVLYVNTTAEGGGRCRKKTPRAATPGARAWH